MPRKQPSDHAAELQKAFDRWERIIAHGANDPFWPDGVNLGLLKNQILYHRAQLEENPTLFGFPAVYYREVPPEVEPGFMARADEIRAAAKASLETYKADPNYQFILARSHAIPPKVRDKMLVGYALNNVSGLQSAVAADDLLAMRRHEQPDSTLETFARCASQMRDYLQGEEMESAETPAFDEPEDEGFEDEFDEDFDEDPEEEFTSMTMTM